MSPKKKKKQQLLIQNIMNEEEEECYCLPVSKPTLIFINLLVRIMEKHEDQVDLQERLQNFSNLLDWRKLWGSSKSPPDVEKQMWHIFFDFPLNILIFGLKEKKMDVSLYL